MNRLIVCLSEGTSPTIFNLRGLSAPPTHEQLYDKFNQKRSKSELETRISNTHIVTCANQSDADILIATLREKKEVSSVEYDEVNELAWTPNDPEYVANMQWSLSRINMGTGWDHALRRGRGIIVAVVDGGIDSTHPELTGRLWQDAQGNYGMNFTSQGGIYDTTDFNGHGTMVAGIIAANANNSFGIAGIAPNTQLMSIKVFGPNAGDGSNAMIVRGILYAIDNGAKVINNSWAPVNPTPISYVQTAIDYAYDKGAIVVCAAGNRNQDVRNYYPANSQKVISVGATDHNDAKISTSNYGYLLSISAPGASTARPIRVLQRSTGAIINSGQDTSFAAAHVSGVVALMLSKNNQLKMENVRYLLEAFSDRLNTPLPMGRGRLNAFNSLSQTPNNAFKAFITINKLRIIDCDDDDEDMEIKLKVIGVFKDGKQGVLHSAENLHAEVEDDNEKDSTFFAGNVAQSAIDLEQIIIDVDLKTRDGGTLIPLGGTGYNWGGSHKHVKNLSNMFGGVYQYTERKGQSDNPNTQGEYELTFTIFLYCQFIETQNVCNQYPED